MLDVLENGSQLIAHGALGREPAADSRGFRSRAGWQAGGQAVVVLIVECAARSGMGNTAQDLLAGGRDFSKAAIRDRSSRGARANPQVHSTLYGIST
jgi:hypothetical protein